MKRAAGRVHGPQPVNVFVGVAVVGYVKALGDGRWRAFSSHSQLVAIFRGIGVAESWVREEIYCVRNGKRHRTNVYDHAAIEVQP